MTHELQTWHWVVTFWTNFCQNHPKTIIPRWLRLRLPRSRGHVSTCPWGTQTIFQSTHASNSQLGLGYKAWYILIPFCSHQNITIGYRIYVFFLFLSPIDQLMKHDETSSPACPASPSLSETSCRGLIESCQSMPPVIAMNRVLSEPNRRNRRGKRGFLEMWTINIIHGDGKGWG